MKILITGINGFIGKNLLHHLIKKKNYKIMVIVKKNKNVLPKNIEIVKSDISKLNNKNLDEIKKFKPEILINLAWYGIPNFSYTNCLKNLDMHINFINNIYQVSSIKKIIMTGSCWEYPDNAGRCKEIDTVKLNSFFSWAKNSIYNYYKIISRMKGIKLVWFRIFFVYGQYQKKNSLIPSVINSLKNLKKPNILNPLNKNDFIYIDDVCRAIMVSIKKKNIDGVFNVGSGYTSTVEGIYNKILLKMGKRNINFQLKKKKFKKTKTNFADLKKISKELNWHPKINIDTGLVKMINFYNG